ncbi:MAG: hypothetical protein GY839_14810 [candidate division Zixibacteria bacterium]|nr:hypothetical protein [candidate division Zixibacteria bacterium]
MRISKIIVISLSLSLLCWWSVAGAVDIQVSNWGNLDSAQQAVINEKISLWEGRLPAFGPPDHVVQLEFNMEDMGTLRYPYFTPDAELMRALLDRDDPELTTLGVTDNFGYDANGRPTSARIRFNSNAAVNWYYGLLPPVPEDEFDFYTVANHEIAHALGFTVNCQRFSDNVTANPGGSRSYNPNPDPGEPTGSLTPANQGTHTDPGTHPDDLMNPTIGPGERRTPSALDENIMEHNVWAKGKTSGGKKTGVRVHETFRIHQDEYDSGATDLHFKIWQKEDNIEINGWKVEVKVGEAPAFDNVNGHRGEQPEPAHSDVNNIGGTAPTDNPDNGKHAVDVDCNGGTIPFCTWVEIDATIWLTSWNTKRLADIEWTNTALQNIAVPAHGWTIGFPIDIGGGAYEHTFTFTNDSDELLVLSGVGILDEAAYYPNLDDIVDQIPLSIPGDTILAAGEEITLTIDTQGDFLAGHIYGTYTIGIPELPANFTDILDHIVVDTTGGEVWRYLPGDVNMANGNWPPTVIGGDVTYLVNYFRSMPSSQPCLLDGFWGSADANGDCIIIGSDVTKLVSYFRGMTYLGYCPDYAPSWPTPEDLPVDSPPGWPNCED